jgi:hypothetical protein
VHGTLELFVYVWDEADVDLAIGCFKRSNETQWSNVSMTFVGYSQHDSNLHFFDANATECTLSPSHPLEVWNIRFYAHDSLDRWNVSDVINGSINALYDLDPTDTGSESPDPVIITVAAITVVVVIAIIVIVRRRS